MHPNYPYHHNHPSGLVVLNPSFFPRISSVFHRQLELVGLPHRGIGMSGPGILKNIPGFQLIRVRCTLSFYTQQTAFLWNWWNRLTFAWCLRACISVFHEALGPSPPEEILAHSLRGASLLAAFKGIVFLSEKCQVAPWSSLYTFVKHYKIDSKSAFGRKVLQKVVKV